MDPHLRAFTRPFACVLSLVALVSPALAGVTNPDHRMERVGVAPADGVFLLPMPGMGRLLVGQRSGEIRLVAGDGLVSDLLLTVDVSQTCDGEGLLGAAWLPSTDYLYLSWVQPSARRLVVGRVLFEGGKPGEVEALRDFPVGTGCENIGGAIEFSSDLHLLVATGDMGQAGTAGNITSTNGKILRLNPDGTLPPDNVLPGSAVYGMGVRNPGGFARDPGSANTFFTDLGGGTTDEINLIARQANYGWPTGMGLLGLPGFTDPLRSWNPTIDPVAALCCRADHLRGFEGDVIAAGATGTLSRVDIEGDFGLSATNLYRPDAGETRSWRAAATLEDGFVWLLEESGELWRFRSSRGTPGEPSRELCPMPLTVAKTNGRISISVERQPAVTQYGFYVGQADALSTLGYNHGVVVAPDLMANDYLASPAEDGSAYATLALDDTFPPVSYFLLSADSVQQETGLGYSSEGEVRPGGTLIHGCPCPDPAATGIRPDTCETDFTLAAGIEDAEDDGVDVPADVITSLTLSEYGECYVTAVLLGAEWCPPCQAEAPAVEALYQSRRDDGFRVISVLHESGDGSPANQATTERWAALYGLSYPVVADPAATVIGTYFITTAEGCGGIPQTFLFDRDGVMTDMFCGYPNALDAAVDRVLRP